ncbi:hypothetical protein [Leifsonia sp. Leaf264]|uniref:hypothetical protein n=1 Tax=Leifsonia sp. Leaf264 TaxID=1736314 RepID=UPI0006F8DE6B|nr:hypothetical protein [Leifsonia sp. Leaf264]KQP01424.1 hypothetical protein ASF30_02060 [Leifsonia sp. Leaf264]
MNSSNVMLDANIGGELWLPRYPEFESVVGESAIRLVENDVRDFRAEVGDVEGWPQLGWRYTDLVRGALALADDAILAAKDTDGLYVSPRGDIQVSHLVLLPSIHGGHFRVRMTLAETFGVVHTGLTVWNDYLVGDFRGQAADHPDFDEHNDAIADAVADLLEAVFDGRPVGEGTRTSTSD